MEKKRKKLPFCRPACETLTGDAAGVKEKNPEAVSSVRSGRLKGGKTRAEKRSPKKRTAIAQKAAKTRRGKKDGK